MSISRFLGGRNIKNLLLTVKELESKGLLPIIDYVGEGRNRFQTVHNSITFLDNKILAVKLSGIGMCSRNLESILINARKHKCTVLVDAESVAETPEIIKCTEQALLRCHHGQVYSTIQCYRKDALDLLERDLTIYGISHGIKLVRGAYWHQDRRTGQLWLTREETDRCFRQALDVLSREPNPVIVATHNRDTCQYAAGLSLQFQYAQLLGMGDSLSQDLLVQGYKVYKYVPWGPWREAIPYLSRRLWENLDIVKHI